MEKKKEFNLKSLFFGNLNKKITTFIILIISILFISSIFVFYNYSILGSNIVENFDTFSKLSISKSTEIIEDSSKELIKQKSLSVSDEIKIFLDFYGNYDIKLLRNNETLKSIAVQKVGDTGYTAVHDIQGINQFHVNPNLIGFDLYNLAEEFPGFWEILERSFEKDSEGYYDWEDGDGDIRSKYMYCSEVKGHDLIVCATTYMDEFTYPINNIKEFITFLSNNNKEIVSKNLRNSTNVILGIFILLIFIFLFLIYFVNKTITQPIRKISDSVNQLEHGNFDAKIDIKTGDELEELANSFNKSTKALASLDENRKQIDKAKTEFLSITSHELRSPMTPMRAQIQMLLKGYYGKLNNEQKESMNLVLKNTERLDRIISDFLEISRIEAARLKFKFIKTSLNKYVEELIKSMKGFMPEKNIIIVNKVKKLPVFEVDPDRVMQVLRNLLNNAIKFSPNNKKIIIKGEREGNFVKFSVIDQGIGISKENQKRLFEPFFQAEQTIYRKHGGTGLGLAICKGIVESQEGSIGVNSKPGKGSEFFFTIPLKPVKEIKPIRVLFSSESIIDKEIKKLFKETLGPIGNLEFEDLKKNNEITKSKLFKYYKTLLNKGIIDHDLYDYLKSETETIFGHKKKQKIDNKNKKSVQKDIENIFKK